MEDLVKVVVYITDVRHRDPTGWSKSTARPSSRIEPMSFRSSLGLWIEYRA
jgi:hypothetical protein